MELPCPPARSVLFAAGAGVKRRARLRVLLAGVCKRVGEGTAVSGAVRGYLLV